MQEPQDSDLAEAEAKNQRGLERRGNAGLRKEIQEARRIYDPAVEKEWGLKYRNFSSDHMRRAYKVFAEAQHDPFNKVPNWAMVVVKNVGRKFIEQGITPEQEFAKIDITGDGVLDRAEVRRMLMTVVPGLGDQEIATVIDVLDEDKSNLITLDELTRVMFGRKPKKEKKGQDKASARGSSSQKSASDDIEDAIGPVHLHRTPVHRVTRHPPATIEGWDHLRKDPQFKEERELLKEKDKAMFKRIGKDLCLSPRPMTNVPGSTPKYTNFGGGGDTNRFRGYQWRKDLLSSGSFEELAASSVPDPGGLDIKPGYHITLAEKCPHFVSPRKINPGQVRPC